jgi:hypothetical protein
MKKTLIHRLLGGPQPPVMVPVDERGVVWPDERLAYLPRHRGGRHGLDLTVAAVRGRRAEDAMEAVAGREALR